MNNKKLRSLCAGFLLFSVSMFTITPVLATDTTGDPSNVTTQVTPPTSGSGTGTVTPIVKAKWEMKKGTQGSDDSTAAGAQFDPSGKYGISKNITICAVVTDPRGLGNIDRVYADIYYPDNIALGPNHEAGRQGCGQNIEEVVLTAKDSLTATEFTSSKSLFCDKIRTNNNNLPVFNSGYDYDEICAAEGEFQKNTAMVYCGDTSLSYEDPSGDYRVLVMAQDKFGQSGTLENYFHYNDLTAFEIDFTGVNYDPVVLNVEKKVSGDLVFDVLDQGKPSVRNIGNTRLDISAWQNDMGFGKTVVSGTPKWNVKFGARVGSEAWTYYDPEVTTKLLSTLNLSETDEIDFSITVDKWLPEHTGSYTGKLVLTGQRADHICCEQQP